MNAATTLQEIASVSPLPRIDYEIEALSELPTLKIRDEAGAQIIGCDLWGIDHEIHEPNQQSLLKILLE